MAALAALQVVFALLLLAAGAVPDGPVVAALGRAVADGSYGPDRVPDGFGGTADRAGECVAVVHGLMPPGDGRGPWAGALDDGTVRSCADGATRIEQLTAPSGARAAAPEGAAGWHGSSVLTRPVLALLGLPGLRLVVAGVLALAAAAAFAAVRRAAGTGAATALLLPVAVASGAVSLPVSASSHGLALAVTAAGAAATAALSRYGWRGAAVGAAGAGAALCFVDVSATPATSWALCAAVAGAAVARSAGGSGRPAAGVAAATVAWPVAHGTTAVGSWCAGALAGGPSIATRALEAGRALLAVGDPEVGARLGAATRADVDQWLATTATALPVVVAAAGVVAVALVVGVARRGPTALVRALVLAAPVLVVPLWGDVRSASVPVDAVVTSGSVPVVVGVVVMAAVVAAGTRRSPVRVVVRPYDTRATPRGEGRAAQRRARPPRQRVPS